MALKLTVLGSGIPMSSFYKKGDFRNPSGHLLQAEGYNILLDCGDGIRRKMEEARFDYYDTQAIFISHFHPDHFSLDTFLQAIYVRALRDKTKDPIDIYGPAGIEDIFKIIFSKKHPVGFYEKSFLPVIKINWHEFEDKKPFLLNKYTFIPFKVLHGGMDAYALRFQLGDKIFTYSGDATICDGLRQAAQKADLFLCEAGYNCDDLIKSNPVHLSPQMAGELATIANVKKLIMVHYSGHESRETMIKAAKKCGFGGQVEIASDLSSYRI